MPASVLHRTPLSVSDCRVLLGAGLAGLSRAAWLWMAHCPLAEHDQGGMMFSFNVARGREPAR